MTEKDAPLSPETLIAQALGRVDAQTGALNAL